MAQRKTTSSDKHMARPRSNGGSNSKRGRTATPPANVPATLVFIFRVWGWLTSDIGQQFLSLVVIAFGLLTIVTIYGANSGIWISAWARFLVFSFGWGAYSVAAFIIMLGLLWLRHRVHQPTAWRWRPVLGFELTLLALLTLTQTLMNDPYGWHLVEAGRGGGIVGWAMYVFLSDYFGPLVTGILMGTLLLLGIALAFDLTPSDIQDSFQRLAAVWAAFDAQRQARKAHRRELPPLDATTTTPIAVTAPPRVPEPPP